MATAEFAYQKDERLPPLAWLAVIDYSAARVAILHGKYVETRDNLFVEGVWAGEFSRADLDKSDCVFGSGGRIRSDRITFVSSTATTDFLYHCSASSKQLISNSLPLILAYANDCLKPKCLEYAKILDTIALGIRKYEANIPTLKGHVSRLTHRNVGFVDGTMTIVDKPLPPEFESFESYRKYLSSRLELCIGNGRDPARAHKLKIYSTQSKGYDTTAINALAHTFGIDAAFTIQQGKARNAFAANDAEIQEDDDGTEICNALGIKAVPINRRAFESGVSEELYYWAGKHTSSDFNMCGMTQHMKAPALLLTGTFGEVWYGNSSSRPNTINDELVRWDLGGHGLSEVRLETGFIQVAVPFIGGRSRPSIIRITESDEMSPWRLGGSYDRPIPRRIGEEAGVPREFFGQKKMASVVEFPRPNIPFDEKLRDEYFKFLTLNKLLASWKVNLLPAVHAYNSFASYKGPSQNLYAYYVDRLASRLSGGRLELTSIWKWLDGSIYCFAVNKLISERYRLLFATRQL